MMPLATLRFLSIRFASVNHIESQYDELAVVDLAQNAVVSDTISPLIGEISG